MPGFPLCSQLDCSLWVSSCSLCSLMIRGRVSLAGNPSIYYDLLMRAIPKYGTGYLSESMKLSKKKLPKKASSFTQIINSQFPSSPPPFFMLKLAAVVCGGHEAVLTARNKDASTLK